MLRLPSDVRMNAPLRVPTSSRTCDMLRSLNLEVKDSPCRNVRDKNGAPVWISSLSAVGALQCFDIEFHHAHHGFKYSLRFCRVFVPH